MLFIAKREIYNQLYAEYKTIKNSRLTQKWNGYYINVAEGVNNTINEYKPIEK